MYYLKMVSVGWGKGSFYIVRAKSHSSTVALLEVVGLIRHEVQPLISKLGCGLLMFLVSSIRFIFVCCW